MIFEEEKAYEYRCVLTNDWISSEFAVISRYNETGTSEKNFDIQNNDFGWAHMPFSFMKENVVFLLATAMLKNFYLYLLSQVPEGKINGLRRNNRLKEFLIKFVCVAVKWVHRSKTHILNLYTDQPYDLVFSN